MSDDSLERILQLNHELTILASLGVPLDIEADRSETVASRLQRISSALENRVRSGQSIERAMADEPIISPSYQSAAAAWLVCDDPTVAFDGLSAGAIARTRLRRSFSQWIVYPFVIVCLIYAGLLVLCSFTVPRIEALLEQTQQQPTAVIGWLSQLREWMPVWGIALPLLAVVFLAWQRWSVRHHTSQDLPWGSGYLSASRRADVAQRVTRLVGSGVDPSKSIEIASDQVGRSGNLGAVKSLPPLLGWALSDDLDDESRPAALRMVAKTYRRAADRKGRIWRTFVSGAVGVLVGGLVVLGYGMTVFLTMTELLRGIALGS